jgi:hypothetical protein
VPEIVFATLDPRMAKTEPDPEIQDLLRKSEGLNLALDYLPGSITFDPIVAKPIEGKARLASSIVWFDAFVTNVDRTARNTNLLVWHRELYLIDHGATLIFHHSWDEPLVRARAPYKQLREHVLLPWATEVREADAELAPRLTREAIESIVALIPDEWLGDVPRFASIEEHRNGYRDYLLARLDARGEWMEEAARAHATRV